MMTKITQTQLNYKITSIGGAGATSNLINACKDFSLTNRKHVEMTTRKGVPLIYRLAVSAYGGIIDQSGSGTSVADSVLTATADGTSTTTFSDVSSVGEDADFEGTVTTTSAGDNVVVIKFFGTLNNWVYRNAAVKTHSAREAMFKDAMVKKKQRGSYDHTIHYAWASHSESYLSPLRGTAVETATTFTGGSWENSKLIYPQDTDGAVICLTGSHSSEEDAEGSRDYLVLPQMYLQSRHAEVPADSNVESATNAAKFSVLNKLLSPNYIGTQDEVTAFARDNQDEPPYSLADVGGDWSTAVEIGRLQFNANLGHAASTVIDAPFGFCLVRAQILNARESNTGSVNAQVDLAFRLLSVREMES